MAMPGTRDHSSFLSVDPLWSHSHSSPLSLHSSPPTHSPTHSLTDQVWITAACAPELVLKQVIQLPKPLWREVLELMGGEYAIMSKQQYGEL